MSKTFVLVFRCANMLTSTDDGICELESHDNVEFYWTQSLGLPLLGISCN